MVRRFWIETSPFFVVFRLLVLLLYFGQINLVVDNINTLVVQLVGTGIIVRFAQENWFWNS